MSHDENGSDQEPGNSNDTDSETGGASSTGTEGEPPEQAPSIHEWPPLAEATIRPGANIPGCTINFVFLDPDNVVYVGTAAHCVDQYEIGDKIEVYEGSFPFRRSDFATGYLAYSAWWNGSNMDSSFGQDFALIRIDESDKDKVHPAVRHWGGPTGIKHPDSITHGERVLRYGSSQDRQHLQPLKPSEGYACWLWGLNPDRFYLLPVGPTIPGDSGSPVLSATGEGIGIHAYTTPVSECGTYTASGYWLKNSLDEANERGMNVELATWELLRTGNLPPWPN